MFKSTSVVMTMAFTTTHAFWLPEKRQEPEKSSAAKPTTTTTTTTTTTKKPVATSSSSSKPESTTKKPTNNTKVSTDTKSSTIETITSATGTLPSSTIIPTSGHSTTALPTTDSSSSSSGGIIGGIIAAVAVLIIGVSAFFLIRRKKARRNLRAQSMKPDPFTMGYGNSDPKPTVVTKSNDYYQPPITQQYQPQLSPAPAPAPTPAPTTHIPKSIGSFTVIATYIPTLSDELEIESGDQIELIVEYDDGWCQGINVSKGNTKGVFPRHCIDYATVPSNHATNDIERSKRVSSMYSTLK